MPIKSAAVKMNLRAHLNNSQHSELPPKTFSSSYVYLLASLITGETGIDLPDGFPSVDRGMPCGFSSADTVLFFDFLAEDTGMPCICTVYGLCLSSDLSSLMSDY